MTTDPFAGLGKRVFDCTECSLCGELIAFSHKPFVLFANGRRFMWVYCSDCEPVILDAYKQVKREAR
jgi:hypothetical protein